MKAFQNQWKLVVQLSLVCFLISGCFTVKFVPDYDDSIKNEIIQISKTVDLFWGKLLETKPKDRLYKKFKDQYVEIESDIRSLVMRNEIRPVNKDSTKQAKKIEELWIQDKNLHKEKDTFTDFEANSHRRQYIEAFTYMAKGEDVKK